MSCTILNYTNTTNAILSHLRGYTTAICKQQIVIVAFSLDLVDNVTDAHILLDQLMKNEYISHHQEQFLYSSQSQKTGNTSDLGTTCKYTTYELTKKALNYLDSLSASHNLESSSPQPTSSNFNAIQDAVVTKKQGANSLKSTNRYTRIARAFSIAKLSPSFPPPHKGKEYLSNTFTSPGIEAPNKDKDVMDIPPQLVIPQCSNFHALDEQIKNMQVKITNSQKSFTLRSTSRYQSHSSSIDKRLKNENNQLSISPDLAYIVLPKHIQLFDPLSKVELACKTPGFDELDYYRIVPDDKLDEIILEMGNRVQSLVDELRSRLNSADFSSIMFTILQAGHNLGLPYTYAFEQTMHKAKNMAQLTRNNDHNLTLLREELFKMRSILAPKYKRGAIQLLCIHTGILEESFNNERIALVAGEKIEWRTECVMDCTGYSTSTVASLISATPPVSANLNESILDESSRSISMGSFPSSAYEHSVKFDGYIICTNFRFLFFRKQSNDKNIHEPLYSVPLGMITSISKINSNFISKVKKIELVTKDIRILRFGFRSGSHRRNEIVSKIRDYIAGMPRNLFCWTAYNAYVSLGEPTNPNNFNGWEFYNNKAEFTRMGLTEGPQSLWRCSNQNENYQLSDTYPQHVWIPSAIADQVFVAASQFRSRSRFPILSYYHKSNHATISRCSQPAVGVGRKRCREDEHLISAIRLTNTTTKQLVIFDARPKANAVANTAMGYGYELIRYYSPCSLIFCDIENIHVMRNSLAKLCEAIHGPESGHWLSDVDSSAWLCHQWQLLSSAREIAYLVHENGTSALIHCSDGWDRTSQLVSISCIMLDPYYRTLEGFITLIEKDWLESGHRFALRHAFDGSNSSDRAPIFQQFIEVVWQFQQQYPQHFQFNEEFLIVLLDNMYNSYFGTFLYNCRKERQEANVDKLTLSLWNIFLPVANRQPFLNPFYWPLEGVLYPNSCEKLLRLWERYYFRYHAIHKAPVDWYNKLGALFKKIEWHQDLIKSLQDQ